MQIVIDISEELYKASQILDARYEYTVPLPFEVIRNGIPLPKGHGDLIDRQEMIKRVQAWNNNYKTDKALYKFALNRILEAPTVIEADTESEERCNNDDGWCNTCEYKHQEAECRGCAKCDDYGNLIALAKYKKESEDKE